MSGAPECVASLSEGLPREKSLTLCAMSAGEAEAIYRRADATAKGINLVSQAVTAHGGSEAASLRVAEQVCLPFSSAPAEKRIYLHCLRCPGSAHPLISQA